MMRQRTMTVLGAGLVVSVMAGPSCEKSAAAAATGVAATPQQLAARFLRALREHDPVAVRSCFDPEDEAARRTAQLTAESVELLAEADRVEKLIVGRFGSEELNASLQVPGPHLYLDGIRRVVRDFEIKIDGRTAAFYRGLPNEKPLPIMVRRSGGWYFKPGASFAADPDLAEPLASVLAGFREHLRGAAKLATESVDRAKFEAALGELRKKTYQAAAGSLGKIMQVMSKRGMLRTSTR